jgi:phosphate transport system ATP-binding protein
VAPDAEVIDEMDSQAPSRTSNPRFHPRSGVTVKPGEVEPAAPGDAQRAERTPVLEARDLSLWYGANQTLNSISVEIHPHEITAIIGPSGCGKSTLLRCFNRMNDLFPPIRYAGQAIYRGHDVLWRDRPRGAAPPGGHGLPARESVPDVHLPERALPRPRRASKSKLEEIVSGVDAGAPGAGEEPATGCHGPLRGQQQRLCIARALAVEPGIAAGRAGSPPDPTATAKIEELLLSIKSSVTIAIVTHNMQQAARISDQTAFLMTGRLVEAGSTQLLFTQPREKLTEDYITGRFG